MKIIDRYDEERFHKHYTAWEMETGLYSNPDQISMNYHYQAIIGMGRSALQFIFDLLPFEDGAIHWDWALRAITDDTVEFPPGDSEGARTAWIEYAKKHGYL